MFLEKCQEVSIQHQFARGGSTGIVGLLKTATSVKIGLDCHNL